MHLMSDSGLDLWAPYPFIYFIVDSKGTQYIVHTLVQSSMLLEKEEILKLVLLAFQKYNDLRVCNVIL